MDRREFLRGGGAALGLTGLLGASWPALAGGESGAEKLWLSWNENPLGMSASARAAALDSLDRAHRYPDQMRAELAVEVAGTTGVQPENVVLGCGSTQLLQAVVLAEVPSRGRLILAEPTFEAMDRYQRPLAGSVERVPLDDRHAHDLERMRETVGSRPAVVYLCNPNNPTATLTPSREIDQWIAEAPESIFFAVDEAYFEYVEDERYWSAAKWIGERGNVVVTRTFSKIYAMAGLRLGFGLARADTARRLRSLVSADNANGPVLAAARAALRDPHLVERSRKVNAQSREIATACLDSLGLEHLPSHANFLMHRIAGDQSAYVRRMAAEGIHVGRPFPPMTSFNRLSLGLPAQMERWAEALRGFRARGWI